MVTPLIAPAVDTSRAAEFSSNVPVALPIEVFAVPEVLIVVPPRTSSVSVPAPPPIVIAAVDAAVLL